MNGTTYTTTASQNPGTYGPIVQYNTVANTGGTDGGGAGTTIDPSQSTLSPNFASYVYDMLSRGQGLANLPYQQFTGQRFAFQTVDPTTGRVVGGYSPLEQQAFTGYQGLKTPDAFTTAASTLGTAATSAGKQAYSPTTFTSSFTKPGDYTGATFTSDFTKPAEYTGATFTPGFSYEAGKFDTGLGPVGSIASYMSPYLQDVVNVEQRKAQERADREKMALAARFVGPGGAGAFGGSRYGIESGMAAKALQEQLGDIQSKGLQAAYDAALKQRLSEAQLSLQAQQEAERAKQFGAEGTAKYGLEAQKAAELSRQFGAKQELDAADLAARYGLDAQKAAELSRQFGAKQGLEAEELAARYGLDAQKAAEQSKQFGARFGLDALKTQADIAEALSRTGTAQTAAERSVLQDIMTAGTRQREIAQQPLDFGYQQFQESMKYPYQQATFLQSLLQGMPIQAARYESGESPLTTALIGLLTGAGLLPKEETTTNNAQGGEVKAKYAVGGQVMAPQMGGIRALMPGQAGSFSAMPTPQGQIPPSMVGPLSQMRPDQLQAMYNDPNNTYPKWAVASAYADSIDKLRRAQQYQGQQATQANIQEQQKVPVADQVMSVQAASGGLMKSFKYGGEANLDDVVAQLSGEFGGEGINQVEREAQEEQKRRAAIRDRFKFVQSAGSEPAVQRMLQEYPWLAQEQQPRPAAPSPRVATPPAAGTGAPPAPRVQTPPVEQPTAGLTAIQPSKDYAALLESDTEALRKQVMARAQRSPEEIEARQKEDQARALLQQQRMANMRAAEAESGRQLKDLERRAATPLFGDRMDFLKLAAAIDPRGGFSGVAKGLGSLVKEREALRDTAMKESASLVDKMRLLRLQYQEAEALEAERQRARITGDKEALRNANVEAEKLNVEMRKLQSDIVSRQQDIDVRRESVAASREGTAAQREGTRLSMLAQRQLDRQNVLERAKKRFEDNMEVKITRQMAGLPNATPEAKKKYEDMLRAFRASVEAELRPIDESIGRLRELSGLGAAPAAEDMSGWGQMTVTNPPNR